MDIDADKERNYKLSCKLHPLELDLKKTERGVNKHPTLVLFFSESHSLLPSYAGLSFEMHHSWIASVSSSGVPICPPLRALPVNLKHHFQ